MHFTSLNALLLWHSHIYSLFTSFHLSSLMSPSQLQLNHCIFHFPPLTCFLFPCWTGTIQILHSYLISFHSQYKKYSTLVSTVIKHRIKYANSVFRLCRAVCWALKIAFLLLAALLCSLAPSLSPLMPALLVFSVCVFGIIYTFRILCILPQHAAQPRMGHVLENVAGAH